MTDVATWYLVIGLLSSTMPHSSDVLSGPPPMVGPITQAQCEQTKSTIGVLPTVVSVSCRKAIGMTSMASPMSGAGYVVPIFEGDPDFVTVSK